MIFNVWFGIIHNKSPSIPPSTMTTWPVTWPATAGDDMITIWLAISAGIATFLSGVLERHVLSCLSHEYDFGITYVARARDTTTGSCKARSAMGYIISARQHETDDKSDATYRLHPSRRDSVDPSSRCYFHDFILECQCQTIHHCCKIQREWDPHEIYDIAGK